MIIQLTNSFDQSVDYYPNLFSHFDAPQCTSCLKTKGQSTEHNRYIYATSLDHLPLFDTNFVSHYCGQFCYECFSSKNYLLCTSGLHFGKDTSPKIDYPISWRYHVTICSAALCAEKAAAFWEQLKGVHHL